MSIKDNFSRIVATLVGMLQTRLELVSVELEEELIRFSSYFIYALIVLFCAGVAVSLSIILIVAMYWDDHRVAVLLCLIGFFSIAAVAVAAWLRNQFLNKPRLLEQSIAELKKDTVLIHLDPEQEQS